MAEYNKRHIELYYLQQRASFFHQNCKKVPCLGRRNLLKKKLGPLQKDLFKEFYQFLRKSKRTLQKNSILEKK